MTRVALDGPAPSLTHRRRVREQRVSDVHHHDQTDDLWRAVEISERVAHVLKLARPHAAQEFALTEPPRRLDDTKKVPSEMGGEMKQFSW